MAKWSLKCLTAFLLVVCATADDPTTTTTTKEPSGKVQAPTDFQYAQLSETTNLVSWHWQENDIKPRDVRFAVTCCLVGGKNDDCQNKTLDHFTDNNQEFFNTTLDSLSAGADYSVNVTASIQHPSPEQSDPLLANMTTLAAGWPSARSLAATPVDGSADKTAARYDLSWAAPTADPRAHNATVTSYTATVCPKSNSTNCQTKTVPANNTTAWQQLPLDFYSEYSARVLTIYTLSLDQSVQAMSDHLEFDTVSGPPGPVGGLTVGQKESSTEFHFNWQPPAKPNGPIDEYELVVANASSAPDADVISRITVNGALPTNLNVVVPGAKLADNASLAFRVTAMNLNKDVVVRGNVSEVKVTFVGPKPVQEVKVTREATALQLEVSAPSATKGTKYVVNGKIQSNQPTLRLEGLSPYTEVQLNVATCFGVAKASRFCSAPFRTNTTTNVGAPDEVQNLNGTLVNNKPSLTWDAPVEKRGPIDGFRVISLRLDDSDQPEIIDIRNGTQNEYLFDKAANCKRFNFTVSAFNIDLNDNTTQVFGEPSLISLATAGDCTAHSGFPAWAGVLIALIVLGALGGGAYYFLKVRRE